MSGLGYGKAITKKEADEIIKTRNDLHVYVDRKVMGNPGIKETLVKEFIKRDSNAFIFRRDLITRFFTGNNDADYLVVILGAHPENIVDPNFKPGSFTVVTAGCKDVSTAAETKLEVLNIEKPANEYPPKRLVSALVKSERLLEDGSDGVTLEFTVS